MNNNSNNRLLSLINAFTLLHYEYVLNKDTESDELIKDLIKLLEGENDKKKYQDLSGGSTDVINNLIFALKEILSDKTQLNNKKVLKQKLLSMLTNNHNFTNIIEDNFKDESKIKLEAGATLEEYYKAEIKNLISNLKIFINKLGLMYSIKYFNYLINYKNISVDKHNDTIDKIIETVNKYRIDNSANIKDDPSVIDRVSMTNKDEIKNIINTIQSEKEISCYVTGFQGINKFTNGGLRFGELTVPSALQHKYKSGFTRSLFVSIPYYNKPIVRKPGKKPLNLFISFEDPLYKIFRFIFQLLWKTETGKAPEIHNMSGDEIADFISERLTKNGWSFDALRINPTTFSYRKIIDLIESYEKDGYDVQSVMFDYLAKVPPVGCVATGGIGSDVKDMFTKLRNYFEEKQIINVTPHQMSPDAKKLLRMGTPDLELVKRVAGRGYYDGTTKLDQDIDLEIHLHIANIENNYFLTVQRGKHKDNVIPEKDKYILYKFPDDGMPIPFDYHLDKPTHMYEPQIDNTDDIMDMLK